MTSLVTGATGFLGGHLLEALVSQGRPVRALVRDPQNAAVLRDRGIDVYVGDIRDPAAMQQAIRECHAVFHCAAAGGRHPSKQEIHSTNFIGIKNLLEAIRANRQQRLICISGLSVLGMRNLNPASEDLPWRRSGDFEADTKIRIEQLILDYRSEYNLDVVILRPGIVYGPGDDNLSQVLQAIRESKFAYIGSRKNIVPLMHVRDFVQVMLLAASRPEAKGRIYHIADGTQTTIEQIVSHLAELSGCSQPRLVLPYFLPYVGCLLFELLKRFRLRSKPGPIDRAGLRFLGTSRWVPIGRAQEELGFSPQVFFREGLAATFKEMEKKNHESASPAPAPA
jgi:2-alkyl-3-oxoalkanoate reductase